MSGNTVTGTTAPTIEQRMAIHVRDEHKFLANMSALTIVQNEANSKLCRTCEGLVREWEFLKSSLKVEAKTE